MAEPSVVFISSSRDMTHWAALAATHVRHFAARHGLVDVEVRDYRDIDPAEINHAETWQDVVAAPSRLPTALTIVLLGERVGTPLPAAFRLKDDIHARLTRAGHQWVHVAGVSDEPISDGQVPLTGTLFEYFDAFLPRADGSSPAPLRVVFKGTFAGADEPDFGNGEFRAQIEASDEPPRRKRQERRDYDQQMDWLNLVWSKLYGQQQHAQLFCQDEDAFLAQLERALAGELLAGRPGASAPSGGRIDPDHVELPGLAPYDLDRAVFFLGRSTQVLELARRALQSHGGRRLVPVTGDSGAGKSSLLRAGLLNTTRSAARRREGWRTAFLSLAERPLATAPLLFLTEALADPAALPELGDLDALRQRLEGAAPSEAAERLLGVLGELDPRPPLGHGRPRLLLVVDQLELALDGARLDGAEAAGWQAVLQVLAALGDGLVDPTAHRTLEAAAARVARNVPTTVVVGLPTNRLAALEAELRPGDLIFPLPRLVDETGLREVITQTFVRLGLHVEPRALETLCRNTTALAAETAGSVLPLVSVTLAALHTNWKQQRGPRATSPTGRLIDPQFDIDLQDVVRYGRLELAIEDLGERAWLAVSTADGSVAGALRALPISTQKLRAQSGEINPRDVALSRLLRRLVVVSSDPAEPDRLVGMADAELDDLTRPLARCLREHRLLSQREDGTWWLVHLAVLRNWQRAASWRAAEAAAYRTVATLRAEYAHWQEDLAADEPAAQRWLPTSQRRIEAAIDWMSLRGLEDEPALVDFAQTGMLVAAAQNAAQAGRILRAATWFNDLPWCMRVLQAAGEGAEDACNAWTASGDGSALVNACSHANVELARVLLQYGARPAPSPTGSWTPLHSAAQSGAGELVELLLTTDVELDHASDTGWTALMLAASQGRAAVVDRLLDAGAELHCATRDGWSALMLAAAGGHAEIVDRLIGAGAAIDQSENTGLTALMMAARDGHATVVARLLAGGANVNHAAQDGGTALMLAARNGHLASVTRLLAGGADTQTANSTGGTALHHAATSGQPAIIQLLAARGAALDAPNWVGQLPLHVACRTLQSAAVEALLSAGADQTIENHDGLTPFWVSTLRHDLASIKSFLAAGASLSAAGPSGIGALAAVAGTAEPSLVAYLIEQGADPDPMLPACRPLVRAVQDGDADNIRILARSVRETALDGLDERGLSNLMYASWLGHEQSVAALLELGADPNRVGVGGWTPLMFAALGDWTPRPSNPAQVVRRLLAAGAAADARDEHGRSALDIARSYGSAAALHCLEPPPGGALPPPLADTSTPGDTNVRVEIFVNEKSEMVIFHDKPLGGRLVWIGYHADTHRLEFNFEDGRRRDFGIPLDDRLHVYALDCWRALLVLMNDVTGEPIEGDYAPVLPMRRGRSTEIATRGTLSGGNFDVEFHGLSIRIGLSDRTPLCSVDHVEYHILSGRMLLRLRDGSRRDLMTIDKFWQPNVIKSTRLVIHAADSRNPGPAPSAPTVEAQLPLRFTTDEIPFMVGPDQSVQRCD